MDDAIRSATPATVLPGCLLLLISCASQDSTTRPDSLAAELVTMAAKDQEYRDMERIMQMPEEEQQAFMRAGAEADRQHTDRLREIVGQYGWPSFSMVGEEASRAAFLLAQHADHDPDFQASMLPLLVGAAEAGEASQVDVAYLTDRVRVKQSLPQLYGTQYGVAEDASGSVLLDDDGKPTYLLPVVEDLENLDQRREAVGLDAWIDYERRMAATQGREPAAHPRSVEEG